TSGTSTTHCPAWQRHRNPASPALAARPAPGTATRPPAMTWARTPARRRRRNRAEPDRLNGKLKAAPIIGPDPAARQPKGPPLTPEKRPGPAEMRRARTDRKAATVLPR